MRKKCGVQSAECGVNGTEAPVAPFVFSLRILHSAFRTPYFCPYHQVIPLEMADVVREILGLPPEPDAEALDPEAERRAAGSTAGIHEGGPVCLQRGRGWYTGTTWC